MALTVLRPSFIIGAAALALSAGAFAFGLDRPTGYGASVDWQAVIGPPPAAGSPQAAADRAGFVRTAAGIGSPAWVAAVAEVFPNSPEVMRQISCASGRRISPATTPVTARLLANAAADLRRPVEAAKSHFKRDRPFVGASDTRTCDPRTLGSLGGSTGGTLSYAWPSGHAAQGQLWARTLAAAAPARAASLTAWGAALGDHRVTCRVHWPSDIAAGRRLGDAVFVELSKKPAFQADLVAARAELARAPVEQCKRPPAAGA